MKNLFFLFLFILPAALFSQTDSIIQRLRGDAYGDFSNFREGILDGNSIRTIFNNNGEIARWPYMPSGEWPKGTGHGYLDGFTFFVAAEVKAPGNGDLIHPLEIYYREWVDKDPVSGELWTFTPVPGYSNALSSTPAMSTNKNSWPNEWPPALGLSEDWNGSWYSYFGKDNFYPNLESFFVIDDSRDAEYSRPPYNFFPVAEDHNRKGLGLRVEVRHLQWNLPIAKDILFTHYDIYNISDYDYEKAITGFYFDPGVGGKDDTSDDIVLYDKSNNLIYAFDNNGLGVPNNFSTGYLGFALLETPKSNNEEVGLTSLWVYRLGDGGVGGGWPKDDESIWIKLSSQNFDISITNSNISTLSGAGPFPLDRAIGAKKHTLAAAMIFAQDKTWMIEKKIIAAEAYRNNYNFADSLQELNKFTITLNNPAGQKELKGDVNILWSLNGNVGKTTTYAYLNDRFTSENLIGVDSLNSGNINFNTASFPDGLNYKLVLISFAENGSAFYQSDYFYINNTGKPIIIITKPFNEENISGAYDIEWLTGNGSADDIINLLFRPEDNSFPVELIAQNLPNTGTYKWHSGICTNGTGTLSVEYISGGEAVYYDVYPITIYNERDDYSGEDYFYKNSAKGTGKIEILRINSPDITGHNYKLSFRKNTEEEIIYDVSDLTASGAKLSGVVLNESESPYFDGVRLKIYDDSLKVIDSLTHFIDSNSNLDLKVIKEQTTRTLIPPADYVIDFYNEVKDTGFLDVVSQHYRKLPVKFLVTNLTSGYRNKVAIKDMDNSYTFSVGDIIHIIEFVGAPSVSNSRISWVIQYNPPADNSTPVEPVEGDAFLITTTKPFLDGDEIEFTTSKLTGVEEKTSRPEAFSIAQNYPNPFNPSTKIKFSIPERGNVRLVVYDINGQEIKVLHNGPMNMGKHEVTFDASKLASGTYFYVITYNNQHKSGKMILLK